MRIETKTDNRRKMVQDIAEFTGEELRYVGPPTFSYTVGRLTIDRDGVITSETEEGEDFLTQFLQEKGYLEAPMDEVKIEIPADTGDGKFLQNLLAMIHARVYLLNRITRYETFTVSDTLLEKLEEIRDGLLLGYISKDKLIEISRYVRETKINTADEKLAELIGEIELRVEVELAKLMK